MVPKILLAEQKTTSKDICSDRLQRTQKEPNLLELVITCVDVIRLWYLRMTWKQNDNQCTGNHQTLQQRNTSHEPLEFQDHADSFLRYPGLCDGTVGSQGQNVNHHYYIEILIKLRERVRRIRPGLWRNGWIYHQDNAPSQNDLSVKRFLASKNVAVLAHPLPYSPDLAPCDLFLFPKPKPCSKELILSR